MAAHLARVDLSAHGFYATPDITGFGGDRPFSYFTYGAAASEVELDTLSGDFQVRRRIASLPESSTGHPHWHLRAEWSHFLWLDITISALHLFFAHLSCG